MQGQQFKVKQGMKLFVHHIRNAEEGATVEFSNVLLAEKDGVTEVGAPTLDGAKVVCEVLRPLVKGDKIIVFHMKRRKGSRKRRGHRSQFTEIQVKEITA